MKIKKKHGKRIALPRTAAGRRDKPRFKPAVVTEYTLGRIRKLKPCYEKILLEVLDAILERYERNPAYHFIDTKLSVITGRDFDDFAGRDRIFRGTGTVYAWIQGRGLEAIAGHIAWLPDCSLLSAAEKENRIARLKKMLCAVMTEMEIIRRRNNGRLSFCFNTAGEPLEVVEFGKLKPLKGKIPPGSNPSDLFYSKGLLAAACCLGDRAAAADALQYLRRVLDDIESERFHSDQQAFDPKNKVRQIPGQHHHGQWMIGIFGLALAGELTGKRWCFETGERFIRHVIERHINLGQFPRLEKYDYFEMTDDNRQPWTEDGRIICDPGHALEFIGLASKMLLLMKRTGMDKNHAGIISTCRAVFPEVFKHVFGLGFNKKAGGICKSFDLASRRALNSDMPWWNLPETLRAGMELLALGADGKSRREITKIIALCSNSFLGKFVNPRVHCMAYQTRDARGRVIDVIPATPDADPGYHTGLSVIDFLGNMSGLDE